MSGVQIGVAAAQDVTSPEVDEVRITGSPGRGDTYIRGEVIRIEVTFDEPVVESGSPRLALEIGTETRWAHLQTGFPPDPFPVVPFEYEVQFADYDADGVSVPAGALRLDGGSIRDEAGNEVNPDLGRHAIVNHRYHKVNGAGDPRPVMTGLSVQPPSEGDTFERGSLIRIEIGFRVAVTVTGAPTLVLRIGDAMREALYFDETRGMPDHGLVFEYWVQGSDYDPDGLSIEPDALRLNGGSIRGAVATLDADLSLEHVAFANDPDLKVDGGLIRPARILAVFFSTWPWDNDTYRQGEGIAVGVRFSKGVTPDLPHSLSNQQPAGSPAVPTLTLRIGQDDRRAHYYARRHDGSELYFEYVVEEWDRDENGISIPANALQTNGVPIRDFEGGDADLSHAALGDDPGQKVNGKLNPQPAVTDVAFESVPRWGATYTAGETIEVGVSFPQYIDRLDSGDQWPYLVLRIGSRSRKAEMRPRGKQWTLGYQYTFFYDVLPEDRDSNGVSIGPDALRLMATDVSGRPFDTSLEGHTVKDNPAHRVDGEVLAGLPGTLQPLELGAGGAEVTVDVTAAFYGEVADYSASSSRPRVAKVSTAGTVVTVTPLRQGATTVEVIARRRSRTARVSFDVTVVTALAPVGTLPTMELVVGGSGLSVDVAAAFRGGATSYAAMSTDVRVATVAVSGATVSVTPVGEGEAVVAVTAGNVLGTATQSFIVAVVRDPAEVRVLDAALAALGRSLLSSVTTTMESRFRAVPDEAVFTVGGRRVLVGRGPGDPVREHRAASVAFSTLVGTAQGGRGIGRAETSPESTGSAGAVRWTGGDVLAGSHFVLPLGGSARADDQAPGGIRWTVWGSGDTQSFAGDLGPATSYDGGMRVGHVGVDVGGQRWLAGAFVSRSSGRADYRFRARASGLGYLDTTLTSVQPYFRWAPGRRTEVWMALGAGVGAMEGERPHSGRGREASRLAMWLGVIGGRQTIASVGRVELALRGDAGLVRLETGDGIEAVDGLAASVNRYRVGLETSHTTRWVNGVSLTPYVQVSGRHDGGDGQTGGGLDVAGGVRFAHRELGFGLTAQGRVLALHAGTGYRERGVSVTALLAPGGWDGRGISLAVTPSWGSPVGGDALWRERALDRWHRPTRTDDAGALNAQVGYGLAMRGGRVLTPFSEMGYSPDHRRLRVGLRLGSRGASAPLHLEVAGEQTRFGLGSRDHRMSVIGGLRFD